MIGHGTRDQPSGRRRALASTLLVALAVSVALVATQSLALALTGSVGVGASMLDRTSDLLVHGVALAGVWMATRPADARHPYGYDRFETLTSMAIGLFLLLSVFLIARTSIDRLLEPEPVSLPFVGIAVMTATATVNFVLARFLQRRGAAISSDVVRSESSHVWADGVTDASVVAGLLCSTAGLTRVDPVIGLAVAALVGFRAVRLVLSAADILADASTASTAEITRVVRAVPGVVECHAVRSRGGGRVRIDLHVHVDPAMTVADAHDIALLVEEGVFNEFADVAEVLVHTGPAGR